MIRVHVICEGQTEEMFVNEVLAEVFLSKGIYLFPALVGKPGHKGGNFKFERLLTDVRVRLLDDTAAYCTTFFDFYGLPEEFPGKKDVITKREISDKADCLTEIIVERLKEQLGDGPMRRFIPYVQMYEFEGLLFSNPTGLANAINQSNLASRFQKVRDAFDSPEEINNSPMSAPSKRICAVFSGYDKVIHGSLAAMEIGLDVIRQECQLFDGWLMRIEALTPGVPA